MITAVCLLAGYSSRMGQPKQHIELGNKTFIERIVANLHENASFIGKVIMVGQANDSRSQNLAEQSGALWISNPNPDEGPLSSIRLALSHFEPDSAMLMWPVDHPMVRPTTIRELCRHHFLQPEMIVVPSIDNRRGHPTIFPAGLLNEFQQIPENEGAKKILIQHPEMILHVVTDDVWVRKNLNTPQMLEEAQNCLSVEPQL